MGFHQRISSHLEPLAGEVEPAKFAVYDIESKDGPTQRAGFTRPFMVGLYDGDGPCQIFEDKTPFKWKRRPCKWCKKKIVGSHDSNPIYNSGKPCSSPKAEGRECELLGWEEFHLEHKNGCIDRFLKKLLTPKYNGWTIYAHNGGGFDHLFLLTWLTRHRKVGYEYTVVPVASSIQSIVVTLRHKKTKKNKKGQKPKSDVKLTWNFRDSMKLVPGTLDKLIKTFSPADKGKEEIDLHMVEGDVGSRENKLWRKYLKKDCVGLYNGLKSFHTLVEDKLGGEVGMTAPSTSMKLFRRKYMADEKDRPQCIPRHLHWPEGHIHACSHRANCEGCLHEWIRKAYYGGRTEIIEMLGENLKYFDINSSYVAAMKKGMPVGGMYIRNLGVEWTPEASIEWRLWTGCGGKYIGFAECEVEIREDCPLPPLPYQSKKLGKLIFPAGKFCGIWSVDELKLLDHKLADGKPLGRVTRVGAVVWYQSRNAFKPMMEALWKLRDKTLPEYNEGLSELGKLLGNSFYGKFGMNPDKEEIVFARPHRRTDESREARKTDKLAKSVWRCRMCGKDTTLRGICKECVGSKPAGASDSGVWFKAKTVNAPYIIPQIAAHITSLARICLWNHLMTALSRSQVIVRDASRHIIFQRTLSTSKSIAREVGLWRRRGFNFIEVQRGRVYYLDTDSCLTNVCLKSSSTLGDMKDEYAPDVVHVIDEYPTRKFVEASGRKYKPVKGQRFASPKGGERLKGLFVQPKLYLLEKDTPFAKVHLESCLLADQKSGKCKGCSTYKYASKGLQKRDQTKTNLDALMTGAEVTFTRLEKVRTLAGEEFGRPPQMVVVKKRIVEKYNKRTINVEDHVTTTAIVIHEPHVDEMELAAQ